MDTNVEELSRHEWSSHEQKHVLEKEKNRETLKYIYFMVVSFYGSSIQEGITL